MAPDRDAAGAEGDSALASVGVLVPDESLDPRILEMDLSGASWRGVVTRLDAALFTQVENDREVASSELLLAELFTEQAGMRAARRTARRRGDELETELDVVEQTLRTRALQLYVHFGDDPLSGLDDPRVATNRGRSQELTRRVDEVQFGTRDEILAEREARADEVSALEGRLLAVDVALVSAAARRDVAMASRPVLAEEVVAAKAAVRRGRRTASVPGADFSVVALDAYLHAEAALADNWSSCAIRWWMIAGVARVESRHGQIGGRRLQAGGRPTSPIIGIALDGRPGVRATFDTDDGRLDGDEVWDRAVGPLQFIPETWARRGRDGSGDGFADPQNIYDAAYSTGRYLCALGGNLGSRSSLRAAYFGYNNSGEYVDAVIGHADRYSRVELPVVAEPVENAG